MKLANTIILATMSAATIATYDAHATIKATVGVASEHHFRGVQQTNDASANARFDYNNQGFYAGAVAVDVNNGFEVDGYIGYNQKFDNGLGAKIGFTTYQFTGEHSSPANEINLGLSYGIASVDYAVGTKEEDLDIGIIENDYTFLSVTLAHEGFFGTYGRLGDEQEGDYFLAGYNTDVSGFNVGVTFAFSGEDLDDDESILFFLSKSFDL